MRKSLWLLGAALFAAAMLFVLVSGAGGVSKSADDSGIEAVKRAVMRAAVNCYAIEGAYPENLDYLKKNYGLHYDSDRYLVTYDAFSQNLLPDVFVIPVGGESDDG